MRPIEPLRLGIGYADNLCKAGAIRRIVGTQFGDALPIALHQPTRSQIAIEAQIRVVVRVLDAEVVGFD